MKKNDYENIVDTKLSSLKEKYHLNLVGVRMSDGGYPRDATWVARYNNENLIIDIGWNKFELSLSVVVKFSTLKLPRKESFVYFEPYIEYLTSGKVKAIVPYISENMTSNDINEIMEQRKNLFQTGLDPVLEKVVFKLTEHFGALLAATDVHIQGYHQWMRARH